MSKRRTRKAIPGGRRARLSATDLARGLSGVLNRVRYNRETFVVERAGIAVCELRPARYESPFTGTDLVRLLRALPEPGAEYLEAVKRGIADQPPTSNAHTVSQQNPQP